MTILPELADQLMNLESCGLLCPACTDGQMLETHVKTANFCHFSKRKA
jgi:hypothetical protein